MSGRAFIEWLEKTHLFVVPLDETHNWFRYHHLFQDHLQDRLKRERDRGDIAGFHTRASRWFAENGLVDEALRHAMAAEDASYAVHLVEGQRYNLMNTDRWQYLRSWLDLLPPEAVEQDPLLLCARAFWAIHSGTFHVIVSSLQRAQQLLADLDPGYAAREIAQAEIVVIESLLGLAGPQQAETLERCRSTLGVLPRSALHIRSLAIFIIALSRQMMGDIEGAIATIREELAQQPWSGAYRARMMHYLCIVHIQEGDLLGVLSTAPTGLKIAKKPLATEPLNWCRYDLGMAHYLRGEFEQAEPYLLALLEDRYAAPSSYLTQGGFVLALLYLCQDRNTEAAEIIDFLEATFQETKESQALAMTAAIQVEVALREGRLPEAHTLSQSIEFDLIPPHWFLYVPQLTPIKLLLAEKSPRSLQEARARIEVLEENMRELNRKNVLIDVLALQALVCNAEGDELTAINKLCAALELGIVGGNIRTFVDLGAPMAYLLRRLRDQQAGKEYTDYIHHILAAFPDEVRPPKKSELAPIWSGYQPPNMSLSEPLTKRELQLLKLLVTDLSPQEIAAKLVISPGTVHTHTKNVYRKLDVNKRADAVQRATELGLV